MTDTPDTPDAWLSLPAAALAYGLSERTLRRRLELPPGHKHHIPHTRRGRELRIAPPPGYRPPGTPAEDQAPAGTPPPRDLVPLDQVQGLIAYAREQADELRAERDALAARLDELQAARLADKEEIGRLRGRLEALEGAPAPDLPNHPPGRRRWPWQRG